MSSVVRSCVLMIVSGLGLAGCTPAAFVQRPAQFVQCEVQVCTNLGTGMARCDCKTHERLAEETRRGFWPHTE